MAQGSLASLQHLHPGARQHTQTSVLLGVSIPRNFHFTAEIVIAQSLREIISWCYCIIAHLHGVQVVWYPDDLSLLHQLVSPILPWDCTLRGTVPPEGSCSHNSTNQGPNYGKLPRLIPDDDGCQHPTEKSIVGMQDHNCYRNFRKTETLSNSSTNSQWQWCAKSMHGVLWVSKS